MDQNKKCVSLCNAEKHEIENEAKDACTCETNYTMNQFGYCRYNKCNQDKNEKINSYNNGCNCLYDGMISNVNGNEEQCVMNCEPELFLEAVYPENRSGQR